MAKLINKYDFRVRVAVARWHDGDTFWGVLDQGCGIFRGGGLRVNSETGKVEVEEIRHRCALIQAPEMSKGGYDALRFAMEIAPLGVYPCMTYKADDTFDRPLVDLMLPNGRLFSNMMLEAGYAIVYRT